MNFIKQFTKAISVGLLIVASSAMGQITLKNFDLSKVNASVLLPSDLKIKKGETNSDYYLVDKNFKVAINTYKSKTYLETIDDRFKKDETEKITAIKNFSNTNFSATYATALVGERDNEEFKMYINAYSNANPELKIQLDITVNEVNDQITYAIDKILNSITFFDAAGYKKFSSLTESAKVANLTNVATLASKTVLDLTNKATPKGSLGTLVLNTGLSLASNVLPGGQTAIKIMNGIRKFLN